MRGSFSEEALRAYSELAAEKQGLDFAEGDSYDFTRCVRPDGSTYGTSGKCRKGTETGAKESSAPVAPVPPKSAMTRKDPVASVLRSQEELRRIHREENARLAQLIKQGKVKGVTQADLERIQKAKAGKTIPVLTQGDMRGMSVEQLKAVKKAMDERAFGKGGAPVSNTLLQMMADQNKAINKELARRESEKK